MPALFSNQNHRTMYMSTDKIHKQQKFVTQTNLNYSRNKIQPSVTSKEANSNNDADTSNPKLVSKDVLHANNHDAQNVSTLLPIGKERN